MLLAVAAVAASLLLPSSVPTRAHVRMGSDTLGAMQTPAGYNAVLLSLLSKGGSREQRADTRKQILLLVDEMSRSGLDLNAANAIALVDHCLEDGAIGALDQGMQVVKANGAARSYGGPNWRPREKPAANVIAVLPELPVDDSAAAVAGAALAGAALVAHPPAALVLPALTSGWYADRYGNKGEVFETIGRGIGRFMNRDLGAECRVESASFLVGYLLGLPCCALAPAVDGPLAMLTECVGGGGGAASSGAAGGGAAGLKALGPAGAVGALGDRTIDRILIWLMAPLAVESVAAYKQGSSAPTQASAAAPGVAKDFLVAARRQEARQLALGVTNSVNLQAGGWGTTPADDTDRIRWANAEAIGLLTRAAGVRESIQELMAEGSSLGSCVRLVEDRLGPLETAGADDYYAQEALPPPKAAALPPQPVEPLPLPASPQSEGQQQAWWAADGQAQPVEEAVVLDVVVDDAADSAVEAEVVADGAAQVRAMEAKVAALEARVNKLKQQKKRGSE